MISARAAAPDRLRLRLHHVPLHRLRQTFTHAVGRSPSFDRLGDVCLRVLDIAGTEVGIVRLHVPELRITGHQVLAQQFEQLVRLVP